DQNPCARLIRLASPLLNDRPVSRGFPRACKSLIRLVSLHPLPHNPKVAGSNPAPATFPLDLSVLTGGASVLVHRVANPKGAMGIARRFGDDYRPVALDLSEVSPSLKRS